MILTITKCHENLLRDSPSYLLSVVKFFSFLETKKVLKIPNETFLRITRYFFIVFSKSLSMLFFGLTCLSLTLVTFERIKLQSSDWTQNARFSKLYPNMLLVHFDFIVLRSFSDGDFKFGFFIDLSCTLSTA